MNSTETGFLLLFQSFNWREIRNCPGRYVTSSKQIRNIHPSDFTNQFKIAAVVREYAIQNKDHIIINRFNSGGGIIVYVKWESNKETYVYTLNTESGLIRKLLGLHIPLSDVDTSDCNLNNKMKLTGMILQYLGGTDRNACAHLLVMKWNQLLM